jgi:hypothetical protein
MLTTLVLVAGLLVGAVPQVEPQKRWIVELRGFTYHRQVKPKAVQVEVLHPIYVDDLSAFFKALKKR